MKFAEPFWLTGTACAVLVAVFSIWGGIQLLNDVKRFGVPDAVNKLMTAKTGSRRALKSALLVLSVALLFAALAGPQYGQGTRLIPATNLDCVVVLDYSKSMFARDVAPNRSERAKAEVSRLIQELPGARFGAVAFAGEPLSFPLTSDGAAIAQFFRQLTPNDMPVGGTAIARALEQARELLDRDPLAAKHQKVIILITDGEDLEGNPVEVAKTANKQGIIVHVVQIGGRAPEPIPEVNELGQVVGMRKDRSGKPLTTSLSSQGEEQLTQVATSGGGNIIRSETGQTGVEQITRSLKRFMTEELSERVETVYADVFHYPLLLALVLLLIETFVPLAHRPAIARHAGAKAIKATAALLVLFHGGCAKLEEKAFTRYSPDVDQAIGNIASKDAGDAHQILSTYLSTGKCKAGEIGTPQSLREKPHAAYDLGLALFDLAERFGGRLGDTPPKADDPNAAATLAKRSQEVDCALRITRLVAHDSATPVELRAKAFFLSGNLEFLRHDYNNAVESYNEALRLVPGGVLQAGNPDKGEPDFGADTAFNRALALKLAEEQEKNKPKPPDAGPPQQPDAGQNSSDDSDQSSADDSSGSTSSNDQGSSGENTSDDQSGTNSDDQGSSDSNRDQSEGQSSSDANHADDTSGQNSSAAASGGAPPEPPPAASQPAERPSLSQDERMLDALERAPMFQPMAPLKGRASRLEDK